MHRKSRNLLVAAFTLVANGIATQSAKSESGTWEATGAMANARPGCTATLLPNGIVLVAGGSNGITTLSAELFDPVTGTWRATGAMIKSRSYGHTATLLPNGKILVAGGTNRTTGDAKVAEIYDPATETWAVTGEMAAPRISHVATLLPNGKVLVAGGQGQGGQKQSELYDPATGTWAATSDMKIARDHGHSATLLPNGKVLVAGGWGGSGNYYLLNAELYDPYTGSWTETGGMTYHRRGHGATMLPNGKVLVTGGEGYNGGTPTIAELYDPAEGRWTLTGSMSTGRRGHTESLLPSGKVLVAGGLNSTNNLLSSAELYSPVSGRWSATGNIITPRYGAAGALLPNGKVLIAGGTGISGSLSGAELYDPEPFTLTLLVAEHGEITGNAIHYPYGSFATLTATASPGYRFTTWTGDVSVKTNPLAVLMNSDKTIGATFSPDTNDDDGDGLSNYREIVEYGTNPKNPDTDGDGFDDRFEINTGFDPTSGESTPDAVSSIRTAVEFRFNAAEGVSYRIEDSTDLETWNTVETGILGAGGVVTRFYSTENQPKRYFRARRE